MTHYKAVDIYIPDTGVYASGTSKHARKYFQSGQKLATQQPLHRETVAPSILQNTRIMWEKQQDWDAEWTAQGIDSGLDQGEYKTKKKQDVVRRMREILNNSFVSAPTNMSYDIRQGKGKDNLQHKIQYNQNKKPKETDEESEMRRNAEKEEALGSLENADKALKDMEESITTYQSDIRHMKGQIKGVIEQQLSLKDQLTKWKETWALLEPDPQANIDKLNSLAKDQSAKLIKLAEQWETYRAPLIKEIREIRARDKAKEGNLAVILTDIKAARDVIKDNVKQFHKKEARYKQLLEVYKQLPKESRSTFTLRILELVRNVKKQKVEINKILVDTKDLQKDINKVTENLKRSFRLTEDMIFKDAEKKVPAASAAYKKLAAINEVFKALTDTVAEKGQVKNFILNLEDRIEKIAQRASALNMERIDSDLKQVKEENRVMQIKIDHVKKSLVKK
mmetsp:Transcript_8912/g.9888  ORF Transcript_8912/g.9888 Transcript_8912/m.9888 type:complete len:451 (-) Transcript_8912:84-1436(-)